MTVKTWVQECSSCHGTGLYVGFAEGSGAGVVCFHCKGTGKFVQYFEYTEFTGRKSNPKVTRVYQVNPGISVDGTGIVPGGVSVEEWEQDPESAKQPGKEMRMHTCPAWWYQCADYSKKPDWKECDCGFFSACYHYVRKSECWERWDKELLGGKYADS